jgi:hypothetical protein
MRVTLAISRLDKIAQAALQIFGSATRPTSGRHPSAIIGDVCMCACACVVFVLPFVLWFAVVWLTQLTGSVFDLAHERLRPLQTMWLATGGGGLVRSGQDIDRTLGLSAPPCVVCVCQGVKCVDRVP